MAQRKKSSSRTTAKKKTTRKKRKHLIVWARLPQGVDMVAKGPRSRELTKILRDAGKDPEARCFGGDSCIV